MVSDGSTSEASVCEIRSFVERDVDLWLAEELRVNEDFARWFCDRANVPSEFSVPRRVRTSVMSENGETDVEAVLEDKFGRKFGLLIENKVRHSISADQLGRYVRRGDEGIKLGLWTDFSFLLFAPMEKLSQYKDVAAETVQLSFEDAAAYLRSKVRDLRGIYRAELIARAALNERQLPDDDDGYRKKFWDALHEVVEANYPGCFTLNSKRVSKTTFISARCPGAPRYFRLDLKGHMGEVDLTLLNKRAPELLTFLEREKPAGTTVAFNRGSIALRISGLDKFEIADGEVVARERGLKCFAAAKVLLDFWREHQEFFDDHYRGEAGSA